MNLRIGFRDEANQLCTGLARGSCEMFVSSLNCTVGVESFSTVTCRRVSTLPPAVPVPTRSVSV